MERKEAMQKVADIGGFPSDNVTSSANYLVLGKSNYIDFENGKKTNKILKAEKLIMSGVELEIIDENDFYNML